jgi:hypothetical protein
MHTRSEQRDSGHRLSKAVLASSQKLSSSATASQLANTCFDEAKQNLKVSLNKNTWITMPMKKKVVFSINHTQ